MLIWLLVGCMTRYNLVKYEIGSLPDTYMTSPSNRTDYCELGFAYAEGFTAEEAKVGLYRYVRDGKAAAIVGVQYGVVPLMGGPYSNTSNVQIGYVYKADGILINWGPCK